MKNKYALLFWVMIFFGNIDGYSQSQTAKDYFFEGQNYSIKLNDHIKGIAYLNKAISLYPQYWQAYQVRGQIKATLKDYRGAISDYNKVLLIEPKQEDAQEDAYVGRAQAKVHLADYKGAIIDFNMVPKSYQNYFFVLCLKGFCKYYLKDYSGAIIDLNQSLKLNPEYSDTYITRGITRMAMGQKDEGCLDLSKAGELGNPKAYQIIADNCN